MNDRKYPVQWLIWVVLAACLAGVGGCSVLGGQVSQPERYTLGSSAAESGSGARHFDASLELRSVQAPAWLDSKDMLYRLAYRNDSRLAAYTRSAWAAPPAQLVGDGLDNALSTRGLFNAVLGGDSSGQADLTLQLDLSDFSQHFSSDRASQGRIAAQATLLHTDSGRVIAQHRFVATAPAPSADAAGGVQALTKADAQLNEQLVHWLARSLQEDGKVGGE